jgi:hypothetical protein
MATTPEWIAAASTAVLGILGLLIGAWQFWAQGFRPKVRATIESHRQRVMVEIRNKGRSEGLILDVALRDRRGNEVTASADGFFAGVYRPTYLPGNSQMWVRLDTMVPIPEGATVRVNAGVKEPDEPLTPVEDAVFASEATILPPQH